MIGALQPASSIRCLISGTAAAASGRFTVTRTSSDPASANYLDTLGSMQMTASDYKGAIVSLQKANALQPDDPEISYHLALAQEASGNTARSQAILQTLVKRGGFSDIEAAKNLLASKLKMVGQTQSGR